MTRHADPISLLTETPCVVRRFRLFRSAPTPPDRASLPPARMHRAWTAGRWTIVRERVAGENRWRVVWT